MDVIVFGEKRRRIKKTITKGRRRRRRQRGRRRERQNGGLGARAVKGTHARDGAKGGRGGGGEVERPGSLEDKNRPEQKLDSIRGGRYHGYRGGSGGGGFPFEMLAAARPVRSVLYTILCVSYIISINIGRAAQAVRVACPVYL